MGGREEPISSRETPFQSADVRIMGRE